MRTKYKFKSLKEKINQKYLLSEENLLSEDITKNRIFVNIKKNYKKFSLENTANKEEFKQLEEKKNNNKEQNPNDNIENKNSNNNNNINNKIKNYNYRNRIQNNNNLYIKNKSDSSKKNILMRIYTEEKKSLDNFLIKSPNEEKNKSIYRNYGGTNRNYHLSSTIIKNNNANKQQKSYSIRNNSIRSYYKNISYNERSNCSNVEKNISNNNEIHMNRCSQTKLYKRNIMEDYKNKLEKKENEAIKKNEIIKEKENDKNNEKEKDKVKEKKNNLNENTKKNNEGKKIEKKINRINKFNKLKELDNIVINTGNYIDNNTRKEIQVKRMKLENYFKKRTKTNTNFNFLVHEAHENQRITLIFNKLYDSTPNITHIRDSNQKSNITNMNINNSNINNSKDVKNNNTNEINSLYINTSNNEKNSNSSNTSKIKSMKSIYSILKTHSRNSKNNNLNSNNNSSQNLMKDYKGVRNYSKEQKIDQKIDNNNLTKKERNESVDTTNEDKTSVKTNLSNGQYISNMPSYHDTNIVNERENYFIKKNNDLAKFKIIYKNNKLKNYFKKNGVEFHGKTNEIKVENQIINNNTYNTTYNIFKINDKIAKQNLINIDLDSSKKTNEFQLNSPINNTNGFRAPIQKYLSFSQNQINKKYIDFEILFILEEKLKTIINKVNKYDICNDECFDWIRFYFFNDFFEKEIDLFQSNNNKNNIINIIKEEIICYFLSYEVSFSQNFNRISILLKAIFQLLHNNYLALVSFILNNNYAIIKNDENDLVNQILNIINKELKINISYKEIINEEKIIQIMNDNFNQIYNYYSMIIDNLYAYSKEYFNFNSYIYSFPNCLSFDVNKFTDNDKQKIISLFFYESLKTKQNYSIQDLKKFFNLYINKAIISFSSFNNNDNNNSKNIVNKLNLNNKFNINQNYTKLLKINQNINYIQNKQFLPPIKKPYLYTLVLDLDETLIHYKTDFSKTWENPKKNMLILRPDLIYFLKEMKKIYELVLFSYATYDYIEKILKIIESKEKFFEYILDRRHITYENGSYIKNLSLIGRDLKNVIIIDDKPQAFKMNKENGIFIKPFYGDCFNNKNILKNLTNILKDIRKDVDITGDIRKCILKRNHEIFTKITTGLIE